MISLCGGFLTYPMYHHGETIKYINKLPGNKENGSQLTDGQELKTIEPQCDHAQEINIRRRPTDGSDMP